MNSSKNKIAENHPFSLLSKSSWVLLLAAAYILLMVLPLFQKGTFTDGMLYKTVAYNYAEGLSGFWNMKFTNTSMTFFCEQPPLYFFLLGSFYEVFGSNYLVDRVFTLFLFVFFEILIYLILKQFFRRPSYYFYWCSFLFLSIPIFYWSYVNQAIEPLICLLTAAAILSYIKFHQTKNRIYALLFLLNLIFLFLTKGFQSCFIITLPIFHFLISGFQKKNLYFLILISVLFIGTLALGLSYYRPAFSWFNCYYQARLVLTMNNVGNTTDSHSEIIVRFFTELIVCISLLVILCSYLSYKKKYPFKLIVQNFVANKIAVSLMLASFAGSFPFALSLVQRGFYLLPSFVCFVLAIVIGLKRYWFLFFCFLNKTGRSKIFQISAIVIFMFSVFYFIFHVNEHKRDQELSNDIEKMLPYFNKRDTVLIEGDLWNYFSLHAYLYMGKQVSLSGEEGNYKYLIRKKEQDHTGLHPDYFNTGIKTEELELWEKR